MSALWKELHLHTLDWTNGKEDSAFLSAWARKIPRYTSGCSCKEFWQKWSRANPAPYSSTGDAYFSWSVKAHNAVNTKLGRRQWTVEEAKTHWTAEKDKQ